MIFKVVNSSSLVWGIAMRRYFYDANDKLWAKSWEIENQNEVKVGQNYENFYNQLEKINSIINFNLLWP